MSETRGVSELTEVQIPSPPRSSTRSRALVVALGALVVVDLAGGVWAATSGVNTWGEAWGGRALLAAPVPMIVAQGVLAAIAVRSRRRPAAVAAGMLLAAACLVSVISGFFDGGLGSDLLTPAMQIFQVGLLGVTGVVGLLAVARAREAWSSNER